MIWALETARPRMLRILLVAVWVPALPIPSTAADATDPLDAVEALGERVFTLGRGESGREITAVLGEGGTEVPASMMTCSSCHGSDGKGRAEGGLSPSDITWPALTRPYRRDIVSGRRPEPYDDHLLERAVTMGLDSAGQPLHVAMPRYQLTHAEAAGLVAFLRRLGELRDPGVATDSVTLGVLLPPAGATGSLGGAVRSLLEAAAARVNADGGLYDRRLALRFQVLDETFREAVPRFLTDERIFALVASYLVGAEAELAELLRRHQVPLVGPFAFFPQVDVPLNPQVFYLGAGLPRQARALADVALRRLDKKAVRAVVIHPASDDWRAVAEAIREQGRRTDRTMSVETASYAGGRLASLAAVAARVRDVGADVVFFLGPAPETAAFLEAAGALAWRPQVMLLGALSGAAALAAPESLWDRVFLALPTVSRDVRPKGYVRYQELRAAGGLPAEHVSSQVSALAAFDLLVEALGGAGRALSRERLIAALEGLYQYESAWMPPLTYGPNRRIGATGAYVVQPDFTRRELLGSIEWVSLDD